MIQPEQQCTACKQQPAQYYSCVDVYSDEDIAVCAACSEVLHRGMRAQFKSKRTRWTDSEKLLQGNAQDQLHLQYAENATRRERAERAYKVAYDAPIEDMES